VVTNIVSRFGSTALRPTFARLHDQVAPSTTLNLIHQMLVANAAEPGDSMSRAPSTFAKAI
jgi:hypothetical protein